MADATRAPACDKPDCGADGIVQSTAFRLCAMHAASEIRRLREEPGPKCRYCGANCTDYRSWDGGDLFACPNCANERAQAHRRGVPWPSEERLRRLLRHAVESGDVTVPAEHGCLKCQTILALVDGR